MSTLLHEDGKGIAGLRRDRKVTMLYQDTFGTGQDIKAIARLDITALRGKRARMTGTNCASPTHQASCTCTRLLREAYSSGESASIAFILSDRSISRYMNLSTGRGRQGRVLGQVSGTIVVVMVDRISFSPLYSFLAWSGTCTDRLYSCETLGHW